MWWLSLVVAVSPPAPARFVMEVGGVPVGALSVRQEGPTFIYESTHLFRRGPARVSVRLAVDAAGRTRAGRVPEVLALLSQPSAGCLDTVEERSGRPSRTCVTVVDDGIATGTVNDAPFSAHYSPQGQLDELKVEGARFVRSAAALTAAPDVFESGFALHGEGPALALSPAVEGAQEVAVTAVGTRAQVESDASCLELARRSPGGEVVVGLVVEDGRAWPHAWVLARGAQVDPSALPGTQRRYLRLPSSAAGRLYLELLAGTLRVVRTRPSGASAPR